MIENGITEFSERSRQPKLLIARGAIKPSDKTKSRSPVLSQAIFFD